MFSWKKDEKRILGRKGKWIHHKRNLSQFHFVTQQISASASDAIQISGFDKVLFVKI